MAFRALVAAALVITGLAVWPARSGGATAGVVPAGFSDQVVMSGLGQPTAVAFAGDGRVFVADKSGLVNVYDSLTDTTPTLFADLRTQVYNFIDRGLLGLTLDPQFPARPYVYVLYTYDAAPGGTPPRWGTPGASSDGCPDPPGATTDGCIAQARLSRLTASGDHMTGAEQPLVTGWCQQFPSHSIGTVMFGPDGYLYAGAGDAASYNYADYGQTKNPCGDPPFPAGTSLTTPTAEGGALRAQSVRRAPGQPVLLNGSIIRIDPGTGAGAPGNPFASSADQNARRIIAYGLRNPFRFDARPGTDQLWVGDVGWRTWEEIDRIPDMNDGVAENFGWPCYEGAAAQPVWDSLNVNRCETLYSAGNQTAPVYAYNHTAKVVAGDACDPGSSAITGISFENGSNYPAAYDNALFFADAARGCIWAMAAGGGGAPNPAQVTQFVGGAGQVVQLLSGPGGDLFYVDLAGGALHRVSYNGANHPPTAVAAAAPTAGSPPLTVAFDGSGSSDLDPGDTLTYAWDLDADGQFDDGNGVTASRTYTTNGTVAARLRVIDQAGATDIQAVTIVVGPPNNAPVPVIDAPASSLRWRVGDPIAFSGHGTDAEDGTLAASRLSWSLVLNHCPSNCHTHPMQDFAGVASGSFPAPDHEYPTTLSLVLTATDSAGVRVSTSVTLDPATVDLTFATNPAGLQLGVGADAVTAPETRRVIIGSSNGISAAYGQTLGGTPYALDSWSDGGTAAHNVVAPAGATTYTATYRQVVAGCAATPDFFHTIPTPAGPPAAAPLRDGRMVYGTLGADGRYYLAAADGRTAPPGSGPLECYSGISAGAPAIGVGSSFIGLFARSADNGLWQRTLTSSSAGAWSRLPAGASSDAPAIVVTSGDVVHMVVRGTTGAVYHATRRGTTWSGWENLGGAIVGSPTVAAWSGGGIAIFGRGTNDGVYARFGDTGLWGAWSRVGTGLTSAPPTVAWGYGTNRLDVFVSGGVSGVYQNTYNGTSWGGWFRRDATVPAGATLAAAAQPGRVIVYHRSGASTGHLQYLGSGGWVAGTAAYTCGSCVASARSADTFP